MSKSTFGSTLIAGIVLLLVVSTGATAAISQPPSMNPIASATNTTSGEECTGDVKRKAQITQSSIHAVDNQITTDEPASISGQIVTPQSNQCTVIVQTVMTVPTDMYVSGTSGVRSGGQGKLTSTFRMGPGETQSMAAQVYGSSPGTRVLTTDFLYYPAGHPDETRRLSGFSLSIEATETNTPGTNSTDKSIISNLNGSLILIISGLFFSGILFWVQQK